MKNSIFFLTYNGYYNFTSGIGTQTNIFLRGIGCYYEKFKRLYGDFEVNLVVPRFNESVDGFNQKYVDKANEIIHKFGGKVYICDSVLDKANSDFWAVSNWNKICISASNIILNESRRYKKNIVMAVDPPFLHVPRYIEESRNVISTEIKSIILMYTSSYIHDKKILQDKLEWEYRGIASAHEYKNIKIGKVCKYLQDHFVRYYDADPNSFIPYPSSLFLKDKDFNKLPLETVISVIDKHKIPINKNLVFAFGRMARVKGFDILLKNFSQVKTRAHLVLLASEFENRINEYEYLIKKEKLNCSLITKFSRDLPRALCQYKFCKIVVCPSRSEPFSNIPLEVALWAKDSGPVVLASNVGGFTEEIIDGENGFIFDIKNKKELSRKINYILQLRDDRLKSIRMSAYNKVLRERDFLKNFGLFLNSL